MTQSRTEITSVKTDGEDYVFSSKRIFVNNIDSYHGVHILLELKKLLEKTATAPPSTLDTESVAGEDDAPPPPDSPYEIIATVSNPEINQIDNVSVILSKDDCLLQIMSCGYVVFDITIDPSEVKSAMDYLQLIKGLLAKSDDSELTGRVEKRCFILISTVMTWALTKPLDPDTPEMPFVETDFRKRRPHPTYKPHYDLENEVLAVARKYKGRFGGLVLNIGVTYGGGEDVLRYWFQKAWENLPLMPVLGRGSNAVPLINVRDVATIVYNLVNNFPAKLYMFGVEQTATKQKEIIKSIGRKVGTGMFKTIPKEDGFLIPEIDQRVYDFMTLNVNMEPTFIVETMALQWTSEAPFAENIPTLIKEYKKERILKPFKVVIHGPPAVGKTTLAKQICQTYGLLYISPETVQQDIVDDLTWRVAHYDAREAAAAAAAAAAGEGVEEEEDAESEGEVEEGGAERARQTLALLTSGRPLTDQDILGYIRQRMACHEAQNKGWVLDGYPNTTELCAALYEKGEDVDLEDDEVDEGDKFEEDLNLYDNIVKKLLPDIVVSLEATDEYICDKMMRQPEDAVRGTRSEEDALVRRLAEFRQNNTRDATPLNVYDELDVHPLLVAAADHADYGMSKACAAVTLRMGKPCRYGKLIAAIEEAERKEKEEIESLRKKEKKAKEELEKRMLEERQDRMEYWSELYGQLKEEEEAALAVASEPLRTYLVSHILPTLTEGLLEVATVRPEDPIDYLAEYLFKLNPTGKMLEPGYNLQAELLLDKIRLLDQSLHTLDIVIEPLIEDDPHGSKECQ